MMVASQMAQDEEESEEFFDLLEVMTQKMDLLMKQSKYTLTKEMQKCNFIINSMKQMTSKITG